MMSARDLAGRLGLTRYLRSWRGRCPACDYTSTFSIREGHDGRALFACASCQDREALAAAVALATGQPRPAAQMPDPSATAARARKQEHALNLWRSSEPATGTLADTYLTRRGLPGLAASPALRFRPDTSHPEGGRYPALVALGVRPGRDAAGGARTFLGPDGRKASAEPAKASLGPVWGGAIRLHPLMPDTPLVIGEGIETAASAGRLMGLPAWAALSAGNLAKGVVLPQEASPVVIAADPDDAGRNAARDAWTRWTAEGRQVRIATPDEPGDFNDLIRREIPHA